jgi:hypothetical protein
LLGFLEELPRCSQQNHTLFLRAQTLFFRVRVWQLPRAEQPLQNTTHRTRLSVLDDR